MTYRARRQKPLLFSVHGIYTDGPWQEGTAAVLSPFYDYTPIKYREFRYWAVTKLGLDLLLFLFLMLAGIALWQRELINGPLPWLSYLLASLLAVFAGHLWARRWRSDAINEVYKVMAAKVVNGEPPHLIAHSLGTYIGAKVLQKYQHFRYDCVIFTGSVLRRKFPWQDMRSRFGFVTNEVGHHDPVPYAAMFLSPFVADMGCSGALGFKHRLLVHTISPEDIHPHCFLTNGCSCNAHTVYELCNRKIHNIDYKQLSHSDYFVGLMHAWYSWLPILWNIDPVLYRDFQALCMKCSRNIGGAADSDEDDPFGRLKKGCWGWTKGSLGKYVKNQFVSRLQKHKSVLILKNDELEEAVDLAITVIARNVSDAGDESRRIENRDEVLMRQLEPRTATRNAIDAVGNELEWW